MNVAQVRTTAGEIIILAARKDTLGDALQTVWPGAKLKGDWSVTLEGKIVGRVEWKGKETK